MPADNSGKPPKLPQPLSDAEEAQRLGLTLDTYQRLKRQSKTGDVAADLRSMTEAASARGDAMGDDIAHDDAAYQRMRNEGGIFKKRGEAPGLLRMASEAPGEVARTILFFLAFLVQLCLLSIWHQNTGRKELGALWLVIFVVLGITSMIISGLVWRALGERARDFIRLLIRFWPITLVMFLFLLGLLRMLFGSP